MTSTKHLYCHLICGYLKKDKAVIASIPDEKIVLSNTELSLKVLGIRVIHHCFEELKLHFYSKIEKIIVNVSNDLPSLITSMDLQYYNLQHNFNSDKIKQIIHAYQNHNQIKSLNFL